jgi:predicted phosphodiesterase
VGRSIHACILTNPEVIPYINNQNNTLWIQHQSPRESFSFLVLGDIQCGFRTLSQHVFRKTWGICAFAIQTGDFISHADAGHYAQTLYELKKSNLNVPLFVVPGNHDVRGRDPDLFEKFFVWKQFYFLWSNCLFIFLDNSSSPPYASQLQWLEETLKKNQGKARRTFLFMHRGPFEYMEKKADQRSNNFAPYFFDIQKKFHFDYVFSGHIHDYCRNELDGTTYVANGSKSTRKGFSVIPSYLTMVEVRPEKISDRKITIQASLYDWIYGRITDHMVAHIYPRLRICLRMRRTV